MKQKIEQIRGKRLDLNLNLAKTDTKSMMSNCSSIKRDDEHSSYSSHLLTEHKSSLPKAYTQPCPSPLNKPDLKLSPARSFSSLPRLNFAAFLKEFILAGSKKATTRVAYEMDPNSDLEQLQPGVQCLAQSDGNVSFGKLLIKRKETLLYENIDDELARIESCASADELKQLLRHFYPDIGPGRELWVFHFELVKESGLQEQNFRQKRDRIDVEQMLNDPSKLLRSMHD